MKWLGGGARACVFVAVWMAGCGGGSGPSAGTGNGPDSGIDLQACLSCASPKCSSQSSSCDSTPGCHNLLDCALGCAGSTDTSCASKCYSAGGASSAAAGAAGNYVSCAVVQCASSCVPAVAVGAGDSGTSGSSTTVRCTGTATASCADCTAAAGCDCTMLPGCTPGAAGICDGQITSCSPIFNMEACIHAGCDYDDTAIPMCGGTMAKPCSMLDGTTCQNLQGVGAGCTWTPPTACTGTISCAGLTNAECGMVAGCSLQ